MTEIPREVLQPAVRRGYQLALVARCAAIGAAILAVFILAMLLALDVSLGGSYGRIVGAVDSAGHRLAVVISPAAVIGALLAGAGCALVAVRASHKIAGPAYRCAADLRRMARGDYDFTVATRRQDQLKDMAEELELARATQAGRLAQIRRTVERLSADAEAARPSTDALSRDVAALKDALPNESPTRETGS